MHNIAYQTLFIEHADIFAISSIVVLMIRFYVWNISDVNISDTIDLISYYLCCYYHAFMTDNNINKDN